MDKSELYFKPHSDAGGDEIDVINQHKKLVDNGQFEEATALLETEQFDKGVRASLLNSIQNKIRKLQLYLLNEFSPNQNVYYSDEEPTLEFMEENGYTIWSKPW